MISVGVQSWIVASSRRKLCVLSHSFVIFSLIFKNRTCVVVVWSWVSKIVLISVDIFVFINLEVLLNSVIVVFLELILDILFWFKLYHILSHNFCDCFFALPLSVITFSFKIIVWESLILILILILLLFSFLNNCGPHRSTDNSRPSVLIHWHLFTFCFSHKRISSTWSTSFRRELLFLNFR